MKGQEELHYAGEVYYYDIVRSDRKTLALQVRPGGAVLVRAPRRMKADTIRRFGNTGIGCVKKFWRVGVLLQMRCILHRRKCGCGNRRGRFCG